MGKKFETHAVVDAYLEKPYDILHDVVDNTERGDPDSLEDAKKHLDEINTKDNDYKIVKVIIEEITSLEDAIALQAGA